MTSNELVIKIFLSLFRRLAVRYLDIYKHVFRSYPYSIPIHTKIIKYISYLKFVTKFENQPEMARQLFLFHLNRQLFLFHLNCQSHQSSISTLLSNRIKVIKTVVFHKISFLSCLPHSCPAAAAAAASEPWQLSFTPHAPTQSATPTNTVEPRRNNCTNTN